MRSPPGSQGSVREPRAPPQVAREGTLTRSPFHDHHDPLAVGRRLHAHRLAVNQPVVAKGIAGLQVIGLRAVRLLISLDQEAGAVPHYHPLQVRGHGGGGGCGSFRCGSRRWKKKCRGGAPPLIGHTHFRFLSEVASRGSPPLPPSLRGGSATFGYFRRALVP